jgi:hypothetical protein
MRERSLLSRCPSYITLNPKKIIAYLRIIHFALVKYLKKNYEASHQLFIDLKKNYGLFSRDLLTEIYISIKIVNVINMCQNETYSRIRVGKHFSDTLPVKE